MRYYVIINGVNSLTIPGLAIKSLPSISKTLMRNQKETIDGRNGDLVTELGYSAYDKTLTIGLFGNYDIDQIIAFFNQKGTIVFSDEADKYYNFTILEQIDFAKLVKFRTANVRIHCQPFKYEVDETPIEIEAEFIEETGTNISLNNTTAAPLEINLLPDTQQDGEPTPSNPIDIEVVTGNQTITISNSDNTQSQNYTLTLGNLEYCKIGTYSDEIYKKNDGKWYLKHNIGKVVLNGQETQWGVWFSTVGAYTCNNYIRSIDSSSTINCICDYYSNVYTRSYIRSNLANVDNVCATNGGELIIINKSILTTDALKTWLGTHNITLYTVLETPTEELLNNTLQDELNAIENAMSYDTQTNIVSSGDLAIIVNASAYKSGTNEATINNTGNIYAKPIIALEGSGTIGLYIDTTQLLNINMISDITIDTENMEAYDPNTSALRNRQITGNYENLKLNPGNTKIKFSGKITKATITNYKRWL